MRTRSTLVCWVWSQAMLSLSSCGLRPVFSSSYQWQVDFGEGDKKTFVFFIIPMTGKFEGGEGTRSDLIYDVFNTPSLKVPRLPRERKDLLDLYFRCLFVLMYFPIQFPHFLQTSIYFPWKNKQTNIYFPWRYPWIAIMPVFSWIKTGWIQVNLFVMILSRSDRKYPHRSRTEGSWDITSRNTTSTHNGSKTQKREQGKVRVRRFYEYT